MPVFLKSSPLFALALLAGSSACAPLASANDSVAALAAGGIVLSRTDIVEMASEDLYVSTDKIRVRYLFHTPGKKGLNTIVAFPMPPVFINNVDEEVGLPEPAKDNPLNLLDFHVRVDGKPIGTQMQAHALVAGVDRTDILKKYGIPLSESGGYDAFIKTLDSLPPEAKKELEETGLADWNSQWDENNKPQATYHWTLRVTFFWRQAFPAGRDVVVEHEYKPAAGAFFYTIPEEKWVKETYCTDAAFLKAAARKMKKQKSEYAMLMGTEVHYILTTARNWAGPIGRFHLVLDKGKPQNLISLCWHGLKKTSPTRFEFTAKDYRPEGELKVLFLSVPPK